MTQTSIVDVDRARAVADALAEEWQLHEATRPYRPCRWENTDDHTPVLHLEDVTGIPFLDGISGVEEYQHRARVRAADGDLFAAGTRPADGYEAYCQNVLKLGAPEFIHASGEDPMAVARACFQGDGDVFARLVERADTAGALAIHPYMAIDSVWELARRLTHESGSCVRVLGPPPPVMWVANDKSHFSRLVEEALDDTWLVETHRSPQPRELAEALGRLAQRCERVGLKRTRCASAMGNEVFDGKVLRQADYDQRLQKVHDFLEHTRWHHGEDVLAVEWCDTDLSPSTQLWIPPEGEGLPVLEGVYEQILDGPEKVFVGSRPSTLPEWLNDRLGAASIQICTALQRMGYVGRCSFDFIVTGDPEGDCEAHFIECNGRWGGTSTPMHLVDRVVDADERPSYVATDYYLPESQMGLSFQQLRTKLEDDLYSPKTGTGRFILYNVGPLEEYGKFDIISLGEDPEDARWGLDQLLPKRLAR